MRSTCPPPAPQPTPPGARHRTSRLRPLLLALAAVALALTGLAAVFSPPAQAAANLLADPGFETGALAPWACDAGTGAVTTSPVHTGSYALTGTATSSDDAQCTQTVAVQPSTQYTLSGFVEGDYVYLGVTGSSDIWTPAAASWQQLTTTFTTGAAATSITVYLHGWYAEGAYHADDLSLTAAGTGGGPTTAPPTTAPPTSPTPTPTPTSTGPTQGPTPPSGTVVAVSTATELYQAMNALVPGETIQLAPGTYSGEFTPAVSGTAAAPITLTGPATAVISGTGVDSAYGIHLEASYWHLTGFTVTDVQKGVVVDGGDHDVINGLTVYDIGDEGIHLRSLSSDDVIENCHIHDTGQYEPGYGEGVYLGSAVANWPTYSAGQPDASDDDAVLDNTFGPNVTAENIDAKEGTTGGTIKGNSFNATGEAGANYAVAWVDVKGNGYTVSGNTGTDAYQQGFLIEQLVAGYGCGNSFAGNTLNLGGAPGYGFDVTDQDECGSDPNVVYASNTVTGAGSGESTVPVTAGG
jgi:Carbohydrate binding domain/Right handed beta helix region